MAPDAPVLHDDMFTQGVEPKRASNIAKKVGFKKGDSEADIARAALHHPAGAPAYLSRMPVSSRSAPTALRRSGHQAKASS